MHGMEAVCMCDNRVRLFFMHYTLSLFLTTDYVYIGD